MKKVFLAILVLIISAVLAFMTLYLTRFQTMSTIEKLTSYENYNIYQMDVRYWYDLDYILDEYKISDTKSFQQAVLKASIPLIPIEVDVPDFGCSAFMVECSDGNVLMGRNYDFKFSTSAMLVRCHPKDGYESIAFAALDNIDANEADRSFKNELACLSAPFICLDGINEKGVSIAVLMMRHEPTVQDRGKTAIATTLAIRLVLDRAATTEEAVQLLDSYDMIAVNGGDYHFYITDASGDGRVVEYECDDSERPMVIIPDRAVTNFYMNHIDEVVAGSKAYGVGLGRYNAICEVLDEAKDSCCVETAWKALQASSTKPVQDQITSHTQWSIVFNNTTRGADIVLRRNWDDVISVK